MKKNKFYFRASLLVLVLIFCRCDWFYRIDAFNNYKRDINVVLGLYEAPQSYENPDSTIYKIEAKNNRIIRSPAFHYAWIPLDYELRLIIVMDDQLDTLEINRISTGYLFSKDFKISFPLYEMPLIPDSLSPWAAEAMHNDTLSKYVECQYLYNNKNYDLCSSLIAKLNLDSLDNYTSDLTKNIHAVEAEFRGICLLGLLSALKTKDMDNAKHYWNMLKDMFPDYSKFVITEDPELKRFSNVLRF